MTGESYITVNGPKLHTFLQELTRETFSKGDLMTVEETGSATIDRALRYSNPDGSELSMVFRFQHMNLDCAPGRYGHLA